jgi:hypothetical protein
MLECRQRAGWRHVRCWASTEGTSPQMPTIDKLHVILHMPGLKQGLQHERMRLWLRLSGKKCRYFPAWLTLAQALCIWQGTQHLPICDSLPSAGGGLHQHQVCHRAQTPGSCPICDSALGQCVRQPGDKWCFKMHTTNSHAAARHGEQLGGWFVLRFLVCVFLFWSMLVMVTKIPPCAPHLQCASHLRLLGKKEASALHGWIGCAGCLLDQYFGAMLGPADEFLLGF